MSEAVKMASASSSEVCIGRCSIIPFLEGQFLCLFALSQEVYINALPGISVVFCS